MTYRDERYMRGLTVDALLTRAGDLVTTLTKHSADGRLAMKPVQDESSFIERFTHILEEISIRGLTYQQQKVRDAMNLPLPKSPKVLRALKTLAGRGFPDEILVKFGERRHIAELLLKGRGRISRAGTYNDESLGRARADNEGHIGGYVHPRDAHRLMAIRNEGNSAFGTDVDVPYLGSVEVQIQATAEFFVYCMAESCDVRMFDDFEGADSCLVITKPAAFKDGYKKPFQARSPTGSSSRDQ